MRYDWVVVDESDSKVRKLAATEIADSSLHVLESFEKGLSMYDFFDSSSKLAKLLKNRKELIS